MKELKDIIRLERISKGLTQDQLAKIMNVSKQTVSHWEVGDRNPETDTVVKLADFFNISTDYLLGRTDNRNIILVHDTKKGDNIEIGVNKELYPEGLTHEQVIDIIQAYKKLKEAGFDLVPKNKEEI